MYNNQDMDEAPLEEHVGIVAYKQERMSKNGKPYLNIKIDNQFYNIWEGQQFSFNRGDRVSVWFTRKHGPNGDFCNVKKLTVIAPANQPAQSMQSPFGQAPPQPQQQQMYAQPSVVVEEVDMRPYAQQNNQAQAPYIPPQQFRPNQTVQKPFLKSSPSEEKFDLGMAINGAVAIIGDTAHDFEDAIVKIQGNQYDQLVELLFIKNKALRAKYLS